MHYTQGSKVTQKPPTEWETRAGQSYPSTHAGRTQRCAESCPCLFIFTTWGSTRDGFVVCGPHESDRRRRRSQHQRDNESALINAPKYSPKSPTDSPCYGSRRREGKKAQSELSLSVCCAVSRPGPEAQEGKEHLFLIKGPRTRKGNAGEDELRGPRGRRISGETEGKREKLGNVEGAGTSAVSHYQKWDGGTDERAFCNQSHGAGRYSSRFGGGHTHV